MSFKLSYSINGSLGEEIESGEFIDDELFINDSFSFGASRRCSQPYSFLIRPEKTNDRYRREFRKVITTDSGRTLLQIRTKLRCWPNKDWGVALSRHFKDKDGADIGANILLELSRLYIEIQSEYVFPVYEPNTHLENLRLPAPSQSMHAMHDPYLTATFHGADKIERTFQWPVQLFCPEMHRDFLTLEFENGARRPIYLSRDIWSFQASIRDLNPSYQLVYSRNALVALKKYNISFYENLKSCIEELVGGPVKKLRAHLNMECTGDAVGAKSLIAKFGLDPALSETE